MILWLRFNFVVQISFSNKSVAMTLSPKWPNTSTYFQTNHFLLFVKSKLPAVLGGDTWLLLDAVYKVIHPKYFKQFAYVLSYNLVFGVQLSLNTQSYIKGFWWEGFLFGSRASAEKKYFGPIMSNFWRKFFHVLRGKKIKIFSKTF